MAQEQQTDTSGVTRTADGTIADQSQQTSSSTEQNTSSQAQSTDTTKKPDSQATSTTKAETTAKIDDKSLASKADAKKEDTKAPQGAPEKYEAYTLPEGLELAPEAVEEANKLFKELGLPQAAAQKIVDQHIALMQKAQQAPVDFFNQTKDAWRKELINDKSLGNGKDNLSDATREAVGKTIASLGDLAEPFKEAMDYTGAGDNPAFVRALVHLSQYVTEGKHVSGKGPSPLGQTPTGTAARPTAAQALYPNLPSAASGR